MAGLVVILHVLNYFSVNRRLALPLHIDIEVSGQIVVFDFVVQCFWGNFKISRLFISIKPEYICYFRAACPSPTCVCHILERHTRIGWEMTTARSFVPNTAASLVLRGILLRERVRQKTTTGSLPLHVTGHFFDMLSFLSHTAGTANRTWSGGSTHCRDNSGLEFVSAAMTDVEHKSERLRGLRMTTVVTDWRWDNQQGGKVNTGEGQLLHLGNVWTTSFPVGGKNRSKLIHKFLSFWTFSFNTAKLKNGYKLSASCSKTAALNIFCLLFSHLYWWILFFPS